MNKINPKNLLHSQWTATQPIGRAKHFMVTRVEYNRKGAVVQCELMAIIDDRAQFIDWNALKNSEEWLPGWQ